MSFIEFSLVKGEVARVEGKDSFAGRIPIKIQAT
jgi:hypothetical protein